MTIRESLVRLPVVGGLAYCRWRDLWRSLEEILTKLTFAVSPILISAGVMRFAGKQNQHIYFPDNIIKNLENGELYLFCTSMLATIFYIAIRDRGGDTEGENRKPGFPNQITHILFVVGMIAASSIIFALKRAGIALDPMLLIDISYWFFIVTLAMTILATTINNGLSGPNPITFQEDETNDFLEKFKKHRGQA